MNRSIAIACCLVISGCALTSKSDPLLPRYFSPDVYRTGPRPADSMPPPVRPAVELRLGRVSSGAELGERIVFRDTADEVGFYDERRWTEKPEEYLRRALSHTLFEARGLGRIVTGSGPTLDIELLAFDEIRRPEHLARIRLIYVLHDDRLVQLERTLTVDKPIGIEAAGPHDADPAITAMTEALRTIVDQVADGIIPQLQRTVHE